MAKHWRKKMTEAEAEKPTAFKCETLHVYAVDADTLNVGISTIGDDPVGINIFVEDAQRLADWLRQSYGIVGKAK